MDDNTDIFDMFKAQSEDSEYHFTQDELPKTDPEKPLRDFAQKENTENTQTSEPQNPYGQGAGRSYAEYNGYTGNNGGQNTQGSNYNPYYTYNTAEIKPVGKKKKPKKPKKRSSGRLKTALLVGIFVLVASFIGSYIGVGLARKTNKANTNIYKGEREEITIDVNSIDTGELMTAAEVYAANVNSTVGITTTITTNYWGYTSASAASGSGFIITSDGYILTNFHVVEDSSEIKITLYDNSEFDGELIGYDADNDIAIVKIDADSELTPVVLGDSSLLNVGDDVLTIGNPIGELTFSMTSGIISALDRNVTFSDGTSMKLIQTDAAINSGNSGGALFNMYGEVIGITNAKYSGSGSSNEASIDNLGFAIPINSVSEIVMDIIEKGYISRPYIGVSVDNVSDDAVSYGLPKGAAVKAVNEDSPAEKAGIKVNDIITEANGATIEGSQDLVDIIGKCEIGDELTLKIYRSGKLIETTVEIAENKVAAINEKQSQSGQQNQSGGRAPGGYDDYYNFDGGSMEDFFRYFFGGGY